jgi:uncharacterized protein (DUF488 family)
MSKNRLKDLKRIKKSKKCYRRIVFDTLKEKSVTDLAIEDAMGFIKQLKTDPEFAKKWSY